LAGLRADGLTRVIEPKRSRDHTERMLTAFGATILEGDADGGGWSAAVRGPARLEAAPVRVPGDPSSAAFAMAAAAVVDGSEVRIADVGLNPLRTGFVTTLLDMGADLTIEDQARIAGETIGSLRVRATPGLRAVSPPATRAPDMIDEFPILAVTAAFAQGETRLTGAEELRVKESDRIAMTVAGLRACGVDADELPDGLIVHGRGPGGVRGGAEVATHGDHRIAMAFLVLGLAAREPVTVDQADMIATSFPDFPGFMASLGATIEAA
jgi:3-phosphoshikimate 1-carboxyvinyltransferase